MPVDYCWRCSEKQALFTLQRILANASHDEFLGFDFPIVEPRGREVSKDDAAQMYAPGSFASTLLCAEWGKSQRVPH